MTDETVATATAADDVRALFTRLMDGWNRGSGEAFAAPFAERCDFVAFDGTHFGRRDELVRFHEPLFKSHLKGTRLVGERLVAFQNTRVRPIGRNARGTLLWLVSDWLWKWCLPWAR